MIKTLENAVLSTDLDCQNLDLRNVRQFSPVPSSLVAIDDPGLTGGRIMLDGSVTNESVNATAGIAQSKLNLNGVIPAIWMAGSAGTSAHAARGDLAERLSNKGAANGYAGLDVNGKVQVTSMDAGAAVGSVTSVGMRVPDPLRLADPDPITTNGTFAVSWKNASGPCWFGSDGTLDFQHHEFIYPFYVTDPIVADLFGGQAASKFTSGVFARARMPVAVGVGASHAIGMVPDPGPTASHDMYLGRDMQWHYFVVNDPALVYQPKVKDVTIVLDWWKAGGGTVTIRSFIHGATLFYRVTPEGGIPAAFQQADQDKGDPDIHITIEVNDYDFVQAYAAKEGYTNSDIEEWIVVTPITDLRLP